MKNMKYVFAMLFIIFLFFCGELSQGATTGSKKVTAAQLDPETVHLEKSVALYFNGIGDKRAVEAELAKLGAHLEIRDKKVKKSGRAITLDEGKKIKTAQTLPID